MKTQLARLLAAAVCVDVAAFVVAFALRHAHHGVGGVAGAIAWFGLWADTLLVLLLAVALVVRRSRGGRPMRTAARRPEPKGTR